MSSHGKDNSHIFISNSHICGLTTQIMPCNILDEKNL